MTTATQSSSGQHDTGSGASGSPGSGFVAPIARQAAHDLLPQLTTRLLDAAADRALSTVQGLAGRLENVAADGGAGGGLRAVLTGKAAESDAADEQDDGEADEKSSVLGKIGNGLNFVLQQAIALLELVKQWITRALAAAKQWLGRDSGDDESAQNDAEDDAADHHDDDANDQDGGDGDTDDELGGDEPARRSATAR